MAASVRDFMNTQLVYLQEGSRPDLAMQPILEFGITAVPVLDEDGRPVGMVSLRDLARRQDGSASRMSERVVSVKQDEPIPSAGKTLVDSGVHHLVVLDDAGRAVGILSAVDVIRALLGMAPQHPKAIESFGNGNPRGNPSART